MLKIALTGGMCSGKSTVAKIFLELGITVIDADEIVHELLQKDTIIYKKIVGHFGNSILTRDKDIDRKILREIIFNETTERKWLENLLHTLVYQTIQDRIKQITSPYCVTMIPLLFETIELAKQFKIFDRILVVEAPITTQIKRAIERDHVSLDQAKKIINVQFTNKIRRQQADDIIINDGSIEDLRKKIINMHNQYLKLPNSNN